MYGVWELHRSANGLFHRTKITKAYSLLGRSYHHVNITQWKKLCHLTHRVSFLWQSAQKLHEQKLKTDVPSEEWMSGLRDAYGPFYSCKCLEIKYHIQYTSQMPSADLLSQGWTIVCWYGFTSDTVDFLCMVFKKEEWWIAFSLPHWQSQL